MRTNRSVCHTQTDFMCLLLLLSCCFISFFINDKKYTRFAVNRIRSIKNRGSLSASCVWFSGGGRNFLCFCNFFFGGKDERCWKQKFLDFICFWSENRIAKILSILTGCREKEKIWFVWKSLMRTSYHQQVTQKNLYFIREKSWLFFLLHFYLMVRGLEIIFSILYSQHTANNFSMIGHKKKDTR